MPARVAFPAPSDGAFDIAGDLLAGNGDDAGNSKLDNFDGGAGAADSQDEQDDEAFITARQAASNRKAAKKSGGGGAFQAMGLNPHLLKAITRNGFTVPTPIQRKTIPHILDGQDVVAMARTGSGKTAAFAIPMVEKLRAHSVTVGVRAIVLSPSRELALQTLKHIKEFGRASDLRVVLLVGGDSLEDQFAAMTSNPDVVVATPGRFCHLLVEMAMDLSAVRYVVFDEADRLFEMGFASQLHEILYALPPSRQTLLFSATLPVSLVEFAKAGLKDPRLIRLDAESKIAPDLESAFVTIKGADKDGVLLHLLAEVIKMPPAAAVKQEKQEKPDNPKKRKREAAPAAGSALDPPTAHSTIIFAATKHHVDYLQGLLRSAGYGVSYVYGSLDQTARKQQVDDFRGGRTTILVVTDVAARGIDIPLLANVINYDFPPQPKVFVHRVGRTARAGRRGWSYSLVAPVDLPYLLDLQLFLGRTLVRGRAGLRDASFALDLVVGGAPAAGVEPASEYVAKLLSDDPDLAAQRGVAAKGEKLYMRTRSSASAESAKRTKALQTELRTAGVNPVYSTAGAAGVADGSEEDGTAAARDSLLAKISSFKPAETVFEIGRRGVATEIGDVLERQRKRMRPRESANGAAESTVSTSKPSTTHDADLNADDDDEEEENDDSDGASEDIGADATDSDGDEHADADVDTSRAAWQDAENFMSYAPRSHDATAERGYSVRSGGSFADAARGATLDLNADESRAHGEPSRMRWDKGSRKYVRRANDTDGSHAGGASKRMVTGESGQKIAASFRSGRFAAWKRANRVERLPRTGEMEGRTAAASGGGGDHGKTGGRYKHKGNQAPKRPDAFRDNFHKQKKKYDEAIARGQGQRDGDKGKRSTTGELRGVDEVRKQRQLKQRRREKNARPSRNKGRAGA